MADEPSFPAAADDDSEDVRWALETANTMWSRGEARDALRWLRRAAETASEEENDLRSVVLAAAAADLRNHLDQRGIPHTEFPPPADEADDEEEIVVEESISEASRPAPFSAEIDLEEDGAEAEEAEEEEDAAPTQRTVPPEASSSAPPAPSPRIPSPKGSSPKGSSPKRPAIPRPPGAPKGKAPPVKGSASRPRGAPSRPSPGGRTTDRGERAPVHATLRVAVAPGDRRGAFTVTVLGPDEHAGEDATEALLVPLDPDTHYA